MPEGDVAVVEAPVAPAAKVKKPHWKTLAKAKRAEAAATVPAPCDDPVFAPEPAGFLSWDEFCNRVAVDLVTSSFGFQMLTNYSTDEAAQVFHARMALSYRCMRQAHASGPTA